MKIHEDFLPNFLVVEPEIGKGVDPMDEAMNMAGRDWAKEGYKGIIWDTMTETATRVLMAVAATTTFGVKHITIGTGANAIRIPDRGDYRAAQTVAATLQKMLFRQDCHLMVLGHEGVETKGKGEDIEILNGGFALVGQAKIATYGAMFDQYIRLYPWKTMKDGQMVATQVRAQLLAGTLYGAGIRGDTESPPAWLEVPNTLEGQVEWWKQILEISGIALDRPLTGFLRGAMYAAPKVGKTRLAGSLAALVGPCVYLAWDDDSKRLRSIFRKLKEQTNA